MTIARLPLSALFLAAMAGCTAQTAVEPAPIPPVASESPGCGAEQLGAYVGRDATDDTLAAIRGWRGENPVRVLKPGSIMTMDYRPNRLNVYLDDKGRITEFKCN